MADSDYLRAGIERFLHDFDVPKERLETLGRFLSLNGKPDVKSVSLEYSGPDFFRFDGHDVNLRSAGTELSESVKAQRALEFRLTINLTGNKSLQDIERLLNSAGIPSKDVTKYHDKCYAMEQEQLKGFNVEFYVVD